jgi:hypothetical protein
LAFALELARYLESEHVEVPGEAAPHVGNRE